MCGAPFLAALRDAAEPLLRLPLVGDLAQLSRTRRVLVGVVVVLLLLLPLALLTVLP